MNMYLQCSAKGAHSRERTSARPPLGRATALPHGAKSPARASTARACTPRDHTGRLVIHVTPRRTVRLSKISTNHQQNRANAGTRAGPLWTSIMYGNIGTRSVALQETYRSHRSSRSATSHFTFYIRNRYRFGYSH